MEDNYNYASGYACGWIVNKSKKAECEKVRDARKTQKSDAKSGNTETDKLIAQAALLKAGQPQTDTQMSPLAITGIIVGSLLAITVMVVVIKKVKK